MKSKEQLINEKTHDFESLVSVMKALRSEGGCPWDAEQTHKSIRKCLIEETYEVIEAIDTDDAVLMCEELGDLLFQIVFHAQIKAEEKKFDINDVIDGISAKMIHRHPHVFGTVKVSDSGEVLNNWDAIKKEEKHISDKKSEIDRVPPGLPALIRAQKVQGKAIRKFGYGTKSAEQAVENAEKCLSSGDIESKNIADAVFSLCAAAEMLGIDMEAALTKRTDDFVESFDRSLTNNTNISN